ncbi:MAG: hypothetical protein QGG72_14375, partial [Verrucomicrobiota bacterium]|nr:hypothetical protein [Verrucomicrobiota bacterium]
GSDGTVVRTIKTDLPALGGRKPENWPFTAIRLANGNTLVNLTHGNKTVGFDPSGNVTWRSTTRMSVAASMTRAVDNACRTATPSS